MIGNPLIIQPEIRNSYFARPEYVANIPSKGEGSIKREKI